MFQNNFFVNIISQSTDIIKALENAPIPEDSSFTIAAYKNQDELNSEIVRDSAIIADCSLPIDFEKLLQLNADFLVLLATTQNMPSASILSKANAIWTMGADKPYDENLLAAYYSRLMDLMKLSADNRKLNTCLTTAIDSNPDLIWFKNSVGAHLIVNNSFCKAVEKTKEQIFRQGHYYIWDIPKSEYDQGDYVCLESEEIVINARKTCLFDEKVKTKGGMRQFKTYKSPLIDKNGEVFGTCGIAHDVTDIQNKNNELDIVLESMPYALVVTGKDDVVISTNSRFNHYFPEDSEIIGTKFSDHVNSIFCDTTKTADGLIEIHKTIDGAIKHFIYNEEPIFDVFHTQIGRLIVFRDVTLERDYEQQTLRHANTDFLTKLHNRRSLFDYLKTTHSSPQLTFVIVDLDNFKKVNDNFGHQMGDNALVSTSRLLEQCFPDDFIARMGGDEFLIVITDEKTNAELETAVKDLLDTLNSFYKQHKEFEMVSSSAGIATTKAKNGDGMYDIETLLFNSDKALYAAKNAGKSQLRFSDDC